MIREGKITDASSMAQIFNHYVATSNVIFSNHSLSKEEMEQRILSLKLGNPFPFLIAEENGEITGYAYLHYWHPDPVYSRTLEVTIYLSPTVCGKGLGSKMLKTLVEEGRKLGAHSLVSFISDGNIACETIHRKAGFEKKCVLNEVGYKFGRYCNDAIYQLML